MKFLICSGSMQARGAFRDRMYDAALRQANTCDVQMSCCVIEAKVHI